MCKKLYCFAPQLIFIIRIIYNLITKQNPTFSKIHLHFSQKTILIRLVTRMNTSEFFKCLTGTLISVIPPMHEILLSVCILVGMRSFKGFHLVLLTIIALNPQFMSPWWGFYLLPKMSFQLVFENCEITTTWVHGPIKPTVTCSKTKTPYTFSWIKMIFDIIRE